MKNALPFLTLAFSVTMAHAGQIFVAPNGSDTAPGTQKQPLATPERARDVAREQIKAGQSVDVILQGGNYELKTPLELSEADSGTSEKPVLWHAAKGATVRLSAGRTVSNWRKVSDAAVRAKWDATVRDRVWESDLKAQGITDYGEMSGGFGKSGNTGLELFIDDVPMHISRYPNQGFIHVTEALGESPIDVRGSKGTKEGIFRADDPRITRWKDEKDARVLGYWFWDWADERQKIAAIDGDKITLSAPWHGYGYRKGQYFYGFNLLGEIDQPGEWYLDRERGKLYVLPPTDAAPKQAMVSVLPSVLNLKNAKNITLQGLVFEGARDNAVTLTNCENVQINACTIRNSGKWAARVDGGKNCTIRGCEITGLGDGGVNLSGGDRATLTPANHVVENCHIYKYSRWDRTYQAGISLNGVGCRALHNLIHDAPHQAMNLGGNDHVVEYNEIHNVCEETNDAGALYGWNDWSARGNKIRFNYFHHIYGREAEGANGVYLDDNFSSATIEGNVFEQTQRPIHLGGGRDHQVLNNLFIDCKKALHIDARGLGWRAYGFDELKQKLEQWPYKTPPWSVRYPELLTLLQDEPMAPKGVVVARNIFIDSEWDDIEGKAKPYVKMENNLLEAPRSLLQKGAVPNVNFNETVKKIGFQPLPGGQIGLVKSPERVLWPVSHTITYMTWPQGGGDGVKPRSEPPLAVARVTKAPKIDGVISPDEYGGVTLSLAETPSRDKLKNAPGIARLSHDGKRLYVAVTIPLKQPAKISGAGTWGSADAVEVVLRRQGAQGKPPGATFVLQGFADGRLLLSPDAGAPQEAIAKLKQGASFAAKTNADSWTGEWSIPLAEAGVTFQPQTILGFNIGARRLEADDWLVWTGTGRENWRLEGAGRLVLD